MKQTILMVHNYYQIPGGEDTVVANEKKMLEDNGHKVVLYTRDNSELKNMGIFRKLLLPFTTIYNPKTARDIKRIISEENIDIVHVHNTLNLISPAVYYAALKMKKPVVQTVHNFRLLCPGATFYRDGHICEDCVRKGLGCALKHKCYRGSFFQTLVCVINTKIHRWTGIYGKLNYICLTEFNREKLLNLKVINEEKVFVKPNFVATTGELVPFNHRENQFVFAGRLDKLKGIDLLIKEWTKLGKKAPRLIVCGTGPLEHWCKEFVERHSCGIEIKGLVSNEEVKKIIAKSKAMILPTQWYEGFPMSIVESYSVGTPVICSDLGNSGSVVVNGITGFKLNCINFEQISCLIEQINNPTIYASTYDTYNEKYTKEINYLKLVSIYKSL